MSHVKGVWWDEIYNRTPNGEEVMVQTPIRNNMIVATFADMTSARLLGNSYATGTCNTDGTLITWVSGYNFQGCSGSIVINGASYTIDHVDTPTSLVLTTSASVQTGVTFYTGFAGINFHAFGIGDPAWDTSGIPTPSVFDTQLVSEIYRIQPDSVSFVKYGEGVPNGGAADTILDPLRTSAATNYYGTCSTNGTAVMRNSGDYFTGMTGTIFILNTSYTIASVTDSTNLILNSSAGIQTDVPFVAQTGGAITGRFEPDGFFVGMTVNIVSGTNAGESRTVVSYMQSSGLIQVSPAFTLPIDTTSAYEFTPVASATPTPAIEIRTTLDYGTVTDAFNNQYIREQGLFGGYATDVANSGFMLDEARGAAFFKSPLNKLVKIIRLATRP